MNIHELNEQRIELSHRLSNLGMLNSYGLKPEERLARDAQYRMLHDAWMKAENDYHRAISALSPAAIAELASRGRSVESATASIYPSVIIEESGK